MNNEGFQREISGGKVVPGSRDEAILKAQLQDLASRGLQDTTAYQHICEILGIGESERTNNFSHKV